MCAETLSPDVPIAALQKVLSSASHTEMRTTHSIRQMLALALGVGADEVALGVDLMTPLVAMMLGPESRALVSEPTCGRFTNAVLNSRGRYIDVGRDYRFSVDADALNSALAAGPVSLVYLADPNKPTSTEPSYELIKASVASGTHVLVDRRFAYDSLNLLSEDGVISLGSFQVSAGLPGVEFMVGPSSLMASLNTSMLPEVSVAGLRAVLSHPKQVQNRVQGLRQVRNEAYEALKASGLCVLAPNGPGLWVRMPGIPSGEAAHLVNHSDVQGHSAWTWRDAVYITRYSSEVLKSMLDALERTE